MIRRFLVFGILPLPVFLLCQCSDKDPGPVLVGQTQGTIAKGDAIFAEAESFEQKGKDKKAIKLYDEVATDFGFSTHAGDARYRQAKLLDKQGDLDEAFDAYDKFLKYYPGHSKYGECLNRIDAMTEMALKNSYKGLLSQVGFRMGRDKISDDDLVSKLAAVKMHAPMSSMAAKAQYSIGEVRLLAGKYSQSVAAFRKVAEDHRNHPLAPEALFRVGKILLEDADRGNQNQATIDLAQEAFNDYLIQFPGHKRNAEARQMIASLNQRELQRASDIADYYYKIGQFESAKIYYRGVVKRSKSGKLYDHASARLKEIGN